MSPLERLLQEQVPTRPEPAPPHPRTYQPYWTTAEQDAHWAELAKALGVPNKPRPCPGSGTPATTPAA